MDEVPLILVTCDDGIQSPGLRAAVRAVLDIGNIMISAPCDQQSGSGRSLPPFDGAIHPTDYDIGGRPVPAYALHASPAQAVLHALVELVPRKPAICVSGINFGANIGTCITGSGTVGAALEAADEGVPALAVSLETDLKYHHMHSDDIDFAAAEHFVRAFAQRVLSGVLPPDVDLLKIDIPCDATPSTPWRTTRMSRQRFYKAQPSGRRYLAERRPMSYTTAVDHHSLEPDSDIYAVYVDRVVSVTPLSLDLTSRVALDHLESHLR